MPVTNQIFDKEKSIVKEDMCMKCYEEMKPLYMETDASRVGLGDALLLTREGTGCPRSDTPDNNILRVIAFVRRTFQHWKEDKVT